MKINKGDLIQLDSWFGDVYAEVTESFANMFTMVQYSKDGNERWERLEFKDNVRRKINKKDIPAKLQELKSGVLHLSSEHFGSMGHHVWSHPIVHGQYRSNRPETKL